MRQPRESSSGGGNSGARADKIYFSYATGNTVGSFETKSDDLLYVARKYVSRSDLAFQFISKGFESHLQGILKS